MIKFLLRILAVLFTGFISATIGFIVVANIGYLIAPDFVLNGRQGYEATGSIGFILGALIGLIGSGVLLFGRRSKRSSLR